MCMYIGSIMRVSCLNPIQDAVSWTDKPFSYYVHTIDRSLLEQYFARLKNPKSKDENQVRRDRKGRIISEVTSREGSSNSSATNNQNNNSNSANHVRKRSTMLTKHHSTAFRRLPKRSASLPDVARNSCGKSTTTAVSTTTTNSSTPNTLSKNNNKLSLSKKETSDHHHRHHRHRRHQHHHQQPQQRLMNGGSSIVVRRMRSCSRQRCNNARKWSSRRKRSHTHSNNNGNNDNNKANKISHNSSSISSVENHVDGNTDDTLLLESTVNQQLASLTVKESEICDQEDTGKQFTSDISTDLLNNNNPCENDILSKSDAMKQSTRRKSKTLAIVTTTTTANNNNNNNISNGKLAYSYSVIDDCLSVHSLSSSSSRGQRDSRNSSSSPYVSSLSSANRSPNSQTDETPTTLNNPANNYSQSTLRTIQSHNCCIIPQDDLDRNMSDPSPHIRIKFRISNSRGSQDHSRIGQIKPAPAEEDNMNSDVLNQVKNSSSSNNNTTTTTTYNSNDNNKNNGDDVDEEELSTSVANRRILRKCRQVSNNNNSSYTTNNSKIPNHRTIVLRKRIQKSLRNASEKSSSSPTPTTTHTSYSPKKINTSDTNNNNNNSNTKLKSTHKRSSRDDLHNNLDILHNHTVTQIQSKPTLTQYGLNDKRLSAYTCHYQPVDVYAENTSNPRITDSTISDIHTGHNKAPVPLALTQYLELTKQVFMDHFAMLQSPAYSSTIQSELERERNRQTELLKHIKVLEQSIAKLHTDGAELLNRFTKRLGILITTPAAFFAQARRLIKHHHALEEKIAEFRKQISELTAANQELVKRHQIEAARLLAVATANKSDNFIQHNSMNKTTCNNAVIPDGRMNQSRRNSGLCYYDTSNASYFMTTTSMSNTTNSIISSTSSSSTTTTTRSALHGFPTPLLNSHSNVSGSGSGSSSIIPPPPSLTKVSLCSSGSTIHSSGHILQSNALILPHDTLQYSSVHSRSTPSTTVSPLLPSNKSNIDAPVLLKTLQAVSSYSPTMPTMTTIPPPPTTTMSTAVGTVSNTAVSGCDISNTVMMSSNMMIKDKSNSNHRSIQQTNIPPPPPLLPMHIPSDIRQVSCPSSSSSTFSIDTSSSITVPSSLSSSSSLSYQPRRRLTDKNDPVNQSIPSLLPEINSNSTCYYTPRTYFDVSSHSNKINHLHPSKSMHASVQDLILDEFSRPAPGLSSSSMNNYTTASIDTSGNGNNVPNSPVSRHRRHHHRHSSNRHHHHHSPQKSVHSNPIDYSHQFNLPPRKRHWDPVTTTDALIINHHNNTINGIANGDVHHGDGAYEEKEEGGEDGDWLSSKFPRNNNNHSCVLPAHCSSPTALSSSSSPLNSYRDISCSQISNNNNNNNNNLSPPTLSPISLDESSIATDCSFSLDRNEVNVCFSPSHSTPTTTNNNNDDNRNNSNTTTPIINTTANCMNGLGVVLSTPVVITSSGLCKDDNSGIPQLVAVENDEIKYLPPILYSSHDHQPTVLSSAAHPPPTPTSQTTTGSSSTPSAARPSTSTTPYPVTSVTIHSNTNNPYYPTTIPTTTSAVLKYSEITTSPGLFPLSTSSIVK
uniref:Histone-lysine N-methyltransferase, H3 lysine-79 specific n=1 Tax=Trichobilharzia regenti TaxID=157069 RepID=A0AA85ITZ9_TRIRE|nr:unnamed protein product [Trichobilharzia regenti]